MCRKSSPEGKGSNHRDTHVRWMCALLYYLIGSLVGVTSHFTPLPTGEGLGEGPAVVGGEAGFSTDSPNTYLWWKGKC